MNSKFKILRIIAICGACLSFYIGGGLIGAMIPIYFDYSWLVNIIYGYLGFLGFALVFFMIIYDIKTKMSKTKINTEN